MRIFRVKGGEQGKWAYSFCTHCSVHIVNAVYSEDFVCVNVECLRAADGSKAGARRTLPEPADAPVSSQPQQSTTTTTPGRNDIVTVISRDEDDVEEKEAESLSERDEDSIGLPSQGSLDVSATMSTPVRRGRSTPIYSSPIPPGMYILRHISPSKSTLDTASLSSDDTIEGTSHDQLWLYLSKHMRQRPQLE